MTQALRSNAPARRIRPYLTAALVTVLVSPLIPFAPAFADESTGSISGTVFAPSGDPSTDACVSSQHFANAAWVPDANSLPVDASGQYSLAGLADGTYAVSAAACADPTDYVETWYGGATRLPSPVSASEVVVISGGVAMPGIDIHVVPAVSAPAVSATTPPSISGTPAVGELLTADAGVWQPGDLTFSYAWSRNGAAIPGATASAYVMTADDLGAAITVTVTATGANGSAAATSAPTDAVQPGTIDLVPSITGTRRVGATLAAALGTGTPAGTSFSYQWSRNNIPVAGATGHSYVLTAADVGAVLRVTVTASAQGYETTTVTSGGTATISTGVISMARPTIRGNAQVGAWLTVTRGATTPAGTTWTYRWYRSGTAIAGATSTVYKLTSTDVGRTISVIVTARKAGYATVALASPPTGVIKRGFAAAPVPSVAGTRAVGRILTAQPGTWSPAAALYYQWYRSGVAIPKATGSRYALTASDLGKVMSVSVKGVKSGYVTVVRRSGGTAKIAAGTITMSRPSINGTRRVGSNLSAVRGATSPSGVVFSYQWYRSGKAIAGATAASYRLKTVDQNYVMAVRVTARKAGYTTKSSTSYGTGRIADAPAVITSDGVYRVGADIKPGTYYTGNTDGCYWERAKNFTGSFSAIIDNDYGSGRRMVTISAGDVAFDSDGCGSWRRFDGTGRLASSMPSDGIFAVGADIRPGTYASTGTSSCYWGRLASLSGDVDAINDNDFGYGRRIVQITSYDRFFETSGCGGWTRIG
jgi:hypothetical protein